MADAVDQIVNQEPQLEALTMPVALKEVLKKAAIHDGLAKGLRECCRAIDKKQAYFVVLAEDTAEDQYKQLITALCKEAKIDLLTTPSNEELGEWVGLAKYDKNMKVRKHQKCSCVVVKDFGEQSDALQFILNEFESRNNKKAE
ncbi:ribosomal protein S12 [Acrasis kona]|uniref:40S ribosomal protein S12 n=1 Tax=Acrasis kona TaxID=1008807 RepID=A0AAW2YXM1_9EUKA